MLAIAGVLVALALIIGSNIQRGSAENTPATVTARTALVQRADIEELVRAPGEVTARSANLTIPVSGVVSDVLVKPGTLVQAGQVLVKLDSREAEASLAAAIAGQKSAQARLDTIQNGPARELADAQQSLVQAQARVNSLKTPIGSPDELAAAQAAVDAAVYRYNVVVSTPTQKDREAADANLRAAKANLEKLKAGPGEAVIREAKSKLEATQQNFERVKTTTANNVQQAQLALDKATKERDAAKVSHENLRKELFNPDGTPKKPLTPTEQERLNQAKLALDKAEIDVQSAQKTFDTAKTNQLTQNKEAEAQMNEAAANLEKLQAGPAQQEILNAQAAVDKAQAEFDKVAAGPSRDAINAAQAEINEARAKLDRLNKGASDKDIQVAQSEVDRLQQQIQNLSKGPSTSELAAAQGALEQATALVKREQIKVEQASLLAPYNRARS